MHRSPPLRDHSLAYTKIRRVGSARWQLNISARANAGSWTSIREIRGYNARSGGTNLFTGGTPFAGQNNAGAGDAFDGNATTKWQSQTTSLPNSIGYAAASEVDINRIELDMWSSVNDVPTAFTVESHNGVAFVTSWSEPAFHAPVEATLIFPRYDPLSAGYLRWRVYVTTTQGGGWPKARELEWRASAGGADQTSASSADGGNAISDATSDTPENVYDNSTATTWLAAGAVPRWVGYRFPAQVAIVEVAITCDSTNEAFKTFDVQYWDGTTWTTSWSVADSGVWSVGETKVFTKP